MSSIGSIKKSYDKVNKCLRMGYSLDEACLEAGVSLLQYKATMDEDMVRSFTSEPIRLAKQVIYNSLKEGDKKVSMWFIDRVGFQRAYNDSDVGTTAYSKEKELMELGILQ